MANTTTEIITVEGVSLKTYAKNIETLAATLKSPGIRGSNALAALRSGSVYSPFKPHDEGNMVWPMWVQGTDDDGNVPGGSTARREFYKRVDELVRLFHKPEGLLDVRHTLPDGTIRQCLAEMVNEWNFTTEGVNPKGLVTVELGIPASYWQDVSTTSSGKIATIGAYWTYLTGATAPLDDATYTITGPITNPVILDEKSGASLSYGGAITGSQTLVINADTFSVTGTGGLTPNLANLTLSKTGGRLMRLVPDASLRYRPRLNGTGTSGATGLTIVGRKKFLVG